MEENTLASHKFSTLNVCFGVTLLISTHAIYILYCGRRMLLFAFLLFLQSRRAIGGGPSPFLYGALKNSSIFSGSMVSLMMVLSGDQNALTRYDILRSYCDGSYSL